MCVYIYIYKIEFIYIYIMFKYVYIQNAERNREREKNGLCQILFIGAGSPTVSSLQLLTEVGLQYQVLP